MLVSRTRAAPQSPIGSALPLARLPAGAFTDVVRGALKSFEREVKELGLLLGPEVSVYISIMACAHKAPWAIKQLRKEAGWRHRGGVPLKEGYVDDCISRFGQLAEEWCARILRDRTGHLALFAQGWWQVNMYSTGEGLCGRHRQPVSHPLNYWYSHTLGSAATSLQSSFLQPTPPPPPPLPPPQALERISALDRALSDPPRGAAPGGVVICGAGGSGRRGLARLVAHAHGLELWTPRMGRCVGASVPLLSLTRRENPSALAAEG
jgi:hypothetical protein